MSAPELDPEELRRLISGGEPEALGSFLAVPEAGRVMFEGTMIPILGLDKPMGQEGVAFPESVVPEREPTAAYLVLGDYLFTEDEGVVVNVDAVIAMLAGDHPQIEMLAQLSFLDHLLGQPDTARELTDAYVEFWADHVKQRLKNVLRADATPRRAFLARQPILAAIRYVLTHDAPPAPDGRYPALISAILLSHAMAMTLEASGEDTGELITGSPAYLVLELVRAAGLYSVLDMYAAIDRVVRLWEVLGPRVTRGGLDKTPPELLREATGVELRDIVALGFVLLSRRVNGLKGEPLFDAEDLRVGMDPTLIRSFLDLVSSEPDALSTALRSDDSRFAFLPIEQKPVLRTERGLLVLDEAALWKRITSGLYWIVHDYVKFERAPDTDDNLRWNEAYSEMIEMAVEDQLQSMAPPLLTPRGGTLFYTEEDLERAYGTQQCADAAVDFGGVMLVVEVVSGQLAVATRIEGSIKKFKEDTDRLVIDKCRQLDAASISILRDEVPLTSFPGPPGRMILPVVVVGGGYPVNRLTMAYIREELARLGLLQHPRVMALGIIDIEELEMLEGLADNLSRTPVEVLREWRESSLGEWPLGYYLIQMYGPWGPNQRATRMREAVDETFKEMIGRLKLKPGSEPEPRKGN
jgi:hypothetical protein